MPELKAKKIREYVIDNGWTYDYYININDFEDIFIIFKNNIFNNTFLGEAPPPAAPIATTRKSQCFLRVGPRG